jgi:serine/threonine protein kinase
MTLLPGVKLGPYEILAPLGSGGMGEVYRARDSRLHRDVAIKVLPEAVSRDPDALARFEREGRAVAALSHSNILGIFDIGREDGVAYAVTELLEGRTLRDEIDEARIPVRRCVDYAIQIARGLGAAHERGIVHRDLKPENVFPSRGTGGSRSSISASPRSRRFLPANRECRRPAADRAGNGDGYGRLHVARAGPGTGRRSAH